MPDLSDSNYSETDASNSNAAPNGMPEGMAPSGVNDAWRAGMGALKRFWDRINGTVTSGGSANAYTYTPSNTSFPTAYVAGETYTFKASFANTGAATLNVNALGAKNIYKPGPSGPTALTGGEIQTGQVVTAVYDGTEFVMTSASYGAGRLIAVQTFTASGTYTPTAGMASCIVEMVGGGAAGGACAATDGSHMSVGGGGGGGGYGRGKFTAASIGASQTVTIGAGGTGGGSTGPNGGSTSLGVLMSASGGTGGGAPGSIASAGGIAAPGAGASASSGGTINAGGGSGTAGIVTNGAAVSGQGGSSVLGGGGAALTGGQAGASGQGPGGGGSGAVAGLSGAANNGGSGAAGIVIIYEYN